MNQQQLIQIQVIEQEANQLEQQLQFIEQHLMELRELNSGLDELESSKEKKIFANLGKGIYVPAEIKNKDLIVEVGKKNFVKKSIPEAKEVIKDQIVKLDSVKQQIIGRIGDLQVEMRGLMNLNEKPA